MRPRTTAVFLALLIAGAAQAGERGYFGFAPDATTHGFFLSPTVERVVIAQVVPGSPAAAAGIRVGDEVLEVERIRVHGAKATGLMDLIMKDVGQHLHATLQHPGGAPYSVDMIAVAHLSK